MSEAGKKGMETRRKSKPKSESVKHLRRKQETQATYERAKKIKKGY
jgi:hypothetical protein